MSEDNNEEYFCTLITQPPHSNYNEYDNEQCVQCTVLESAFCDNDNVEYDTESEDYVRVLSTSNGNKAKNIITPERASVPDTIQCETVVVKKEKGKHHYCGLFY